MKLFQGYVSADADMAVTSGIRGYVDHIGKGFFCTGKAFTGLFVTGGAFASFVVPASEAVLPKPIKPAKQTVDALFESGGDSGSDRQLGQGFCHLFGEISQEFISHRFYFGQHHCQTFFNLRKIGRLGRTWLHSTCVCGQHMVI